MAKALEERIKAIMEGKIPPETKSKKSTSKDFDDKRDSAKVIEDAEQELSIAGRDTSADDDNTKIQAGRKNKLESDSKTVALKVKADHQDDNGDNAKIQKGESQKEKGGKLSSSQYESMTALFDGEELTEEFKLKAETIFEAAVAYAVEQKDAELQEMYQQKLDEAVEEAKGELVEQIDGYLNYVVEQWLQDNAVALENGIKVELVNSFMEGMKSVFLEHYIDLPEDKIDVVEEQAEEIKELKEELQSLKEETEIILSQKMVIECEDVLAKAAKGLTAIEEEKFRSLAENVEFDTIEQFAEKVQTIRESYFKGDKSSQAVIKQPVTEDKSSSTVNAVVEVLKKGNLKFINRH